MAFAVAGEARAGELSVHGILDATATGRTDAFSDNTLTRGDNPFDPYGMRVFAEGTVNPQFTVFGQVVFHDASGIYLDGAYIMWTPKADRDFHVLAGKIPWLIGTFGPRTYSDKNPLIGKPLLYQYHTTLVWYALPPDADALLASRGTGQDAIGYLQGGFGMPVVDDSWWDTGVMTSGSTHGLEYALGVTNGTPGWGNGAQDENRENTLLGRIGYAPAPWLRFGVSGASGAYLIESLNEPLPPGKRPEDYHQQILMGDLELLWDRFELRSEAVDNTWETPHLGDLGVRSGYVEGKVGLPAGLWAAARWDVMRFGDVTDTTGAQQAWDYDQNRLETGLGLRWDRNVLLKGVFQRNTQHQPDGAHHADLWALQLSVRF